MIALSVNMDVLLLVGGALGAARILAAVVYVRVRAWRSEVEHDIDPPRGES